MLVVILLHHAAVPECTGSCLLTAAYTRPGGRQKGRDVRVQHRPVERVYEYFSLYPSLDRCFIIALLCLLVFACCLLVIACDWCLGVCSVRACTWLATWYDKKEGYSYTDRVGGCDIIQKVYEVPMGMYE